MTASTRFARTTPMSAVLVRSLKTRTRRGVLLLIVLSLLTLFMLLGTTFIVLSSRARTTSRAFLKLAEDPTRTSDGYGGFLRDAALQVIRGSTRSSSAIRYHDLLADRYGTPGGEEYAVTTATLAGDGQFVRLELRQLVGGSLGGPASPDNFGGRVLTFVSGPDGVRNRSTRIVTSLDAVGGDSNVVYVERPTALAAAADLLSGGFLTVRINSRDYAGSGHLAADQAFQPHWGLVATGPTLSPAEDYDAPDEQNMALFGNASNGLFSYHRPKMIDYWLRHHARELTLGSAANTAAGRMAFEAQVRGILAGGVPTNAAQRQVAMDFRRASLRPFAYDHSPDGGATDFTGRSLADTNLNVIRCLDGDVDSDGDGVIDSVWLDLGHPPLTMADRTLVKPLFAIKCVDLDGRLNVNVHGSPMHLQSPDATDTRLAKSDAAAPTLRLGLGYGPLDVRLDGLDAAAGTSLLRQASLGAAQAYGKGDGIRRDVGDLVGRYGGPLGSLTDFPTNVPRAGLTGAERSYLANTMHAWTTPGRGIPANYWTVNAGANLLRTYVGGPPDFWGRLALGIGHRGHPLYLDLASSLPDNTGSPYDLDLFRARIAATRASQTTAEPTRDQPFTAAELEAILRPFDPDNSASLPPRLLTLGLSGGGVIRDAITTESWSTPAVIGPAAFIPSGVVGRGNFDRDLVQGLRMNLNRPFGNGRDDDGAGAPGHGVVDEPLETESPEPSTAPPGKQFSMRTAFAGGQGWPLTRGPLPPGLPGQPGPNQPGLRARQLYAWHLFSLVDAIRTSVPGLDLVLCKGTWETPTKFKPADPAIDSATDVVRVDNIKEHARRVLAQWAVNVVDFLDADSIMTPFRYGTSGEPVVWGCESPEVIITETLAFHDRGIADTDVHNRTSSTDPNNFDDDWDQVRLPRGSLFVELHAVRDPAQPNPPRELYESDGTLDLGRRHNGAPANAAPVWRLAVTGALPTRSQSDDMFKKILVNPDSVWLEPDGSTDTTVAGIALDRYVWFTEDAPTGALANRTFRLLTDAPVAADRSARAVLTRGDYLVVGPRRETTLGSTPTGPSPQKITLAPPPLGAGDPAPVVVTDFDGAVNPTVDRPGNATHGESVPPPPPDGLPVGFRRETRACWVGAWPWGAADGREWGLNISECDIEDYTSLPATARPDDGLKYTTPKDAPLPDKLGGSLRSQGTHANAATVFLQRLADPTRPHQPNSGSTDWNPYLTVDFMPIDLTVFNGDSSDQEQRARKIGSPPNEMVVQDTPYPNRDVYFHTRQRGIVTQPDGRPSQYASRSFSLEEILFQGHSGWTANPWVPTLPGTEQHPPGPRSNAGSSPSHFKYRLGTTNATGAPDNACPIHTLGWANISFGRRLGESEVPVAYVGAASTPFPWIVWNDRPFANEYELLLVPRTSPGRLLTNYRNPIKDPETEDIDPDDAYGAGGPAGHLLPFTSLNDAASGSPSRSRNADILCRLFSYVRVPSPFAGTSRAVAPTFAPNPAAFNPTTASDGPLASYLPPFNHLSRYREPGRVNVNTIPNAAADVIWQSLQGAKSATEMPGNARPWTEVGARTRTMPLETHPPMTDDPAPFADATIPIWMRALSGNVIGSDPSSRLDFNPELSNPANGQWFLPKKVNDPSQDPTPDDDLVANRFSARSQTLLRDSFAGSDPEPLLGPQRPATIGARPTGGNQFRYDRRNAWFAYEPLMRAAANTTVRSEVYAIWVTMGFFEVASAPKYEGFGGTFSRYPDGYRLLREYGSLHGDIRRHRAFYLFDRSIPVGYSSGSDLNVDQGILVERLVQ